MADAQRLDRTYHFILASLVKSGQAPHYTEIARPIWLYPGTDLIASFAPLNNLGKRRRSSCGRSPAMRARSQGSGRRNSSS